MNFITRSPQMEWQFWCYLWSCFQKSPSSPDSVIFPDCTEYLPLSREEECGDNGWCGWKHPQVLCKAEKFWEQADPIQDSTLIWEEESRHWPTQILSQFHASHCETQFYQQEKWSFLLQDPVFISRSSYPGILEWMKWPSSGRPKPINCAWAVVRDTEESQAGQIVLWGLQRWRQKAIQGINAALNILWNVCMQKDPWLLPETNSDTMEFSRPVDTGQKVSDSVSTSMEMCMCAWLRSECTGTKGLTSTLGKYSSNKPS